jgi:hypothetical protein
MEDGWGMWVRWRYSEQDKQSSWHAVQSEPWWNRSRSTSKKD